jgi:porin
MHKPRPPWRTRGKLLRAIVGFIGCAAVLGTCEDAAAREVKGEEAVLSSKSPYEASAVAVVDLMGNVSGGTATGSRALNTLDLNVHVVGDTFGLQGLSAYADLEQTGGGGFSARYVGDTQAVSNIDATDGITLYEAWVEKSWDDRASLKAGIIDLNTEFDQQDVGAIFVNGSFGMGAEFSHSNSLGPSIFPTPGLGFRLGFKLDDVFSAKLGVFDGLPRDPDHPHRLSFSLSAHDGALIVAELDAQPTDKIEAKFGVWQYTASFPDILQPVPGVVKQSSDNRGAYIETSAHLYREAGSDAKGLDGWLRVGAANSSVDAISGYIGGGLVYRGLIPGRDEDALGVAVASAFYGTPARRAAAMAGGHQVPNETTLEATYVASVLPWLQLQPDIQYVFNPAADPAAKRHAFVAGLELTASWSSEN